MAVRPRRQERRTSYGIGEIFGEVFADIQHQRRIELIDITRLADNPDCRFLADMPGLAPLDQHGDARLRCNKSGGVCSIRNFHENDEGQTFGSLTTTCPIRFYESGVVFRRIAEEILGDPNAEIAKEIPFLMRPIRTQADPTPNSTPGENEAETDTEGNSRGGEDVGRIDMVLVSNQQGGRLDWCAVELQAVYFSGAAMSKDHVLIRNHTGNGIPMPGGNRRPDFRSSGPKRLMPQLQIKVPTLRRWGKKMAVVVDRPFFDALEEMDNVQHVSNADIIWIVVDYDIDHATAQASLRVDQVQFTTLERAVEGLTAGVPTTLPDFEGKIKRKLGIE